MDNSLESIFFAVFECTKLDDFVFDVNKDTHSVRLKVFVDVQVLTPEEHSFEVAILDEISFCILSLQYKLIIRKVFELIIELSILFEAVSDIFVQGRNFLFDSSQVFEDLRDVFTRNGGLFGGKLETAPGSVNWCSSLELGLLLTLSLSAKFGFILSRLL